MEITPPPTNFYDDDVVFEQPSTHGMFIYERRLAKWVVLSSSHKELGGMHKRSGFSVHFTSISTSWFGSLILKITIVLQFI